MLQFEGAQQVWFYLAVRLKRMARHDNLREPIQMVRCCRYNSSCTADSVVVTTIAASDCAYALARKHSR